MKTITITTLLLLLFSIGVSAKDITLTCKFKDRDDGEISTDKFYLDTDSSTGFAGKNKASVTWSPTHVEIVFRSSLGDHDTFRYSINRETLVGHVLSHSGYSPYKTCKMEETMHSNNKF